jgi:hypothetical protein
MDFTIINKTENVVSVARAIGYLIIDTKDNGEYNLVRKLDYGNYPRFHIYLRVAQGRPFDSAQGETASFIFSLHLDQKAPVYKGAHAHNGEYEGPVVETEADRIREILQNL